MMTCELTYVAHQHSYMLNDDINKSYVNVIMLHVNIIYLTCKGQRYMYMPLYKAFISVT